MPFANRSLLLIYFTFFFSIIVWIYTCLIIILLGCSFQEIPAEHKRRACQGAQFSPLLRYICAFWWAIEGFSPDFGLRAFLHKLSEFAKHLYSLQPTIVLIGCTVARILVARFNVWGSQTPRSPTSKAQLSRTYTGRFEGHSLLGSGSAHSFGSGNFKRSCRGESNSWGPKS